MAASSGPPAPPIVLSGKPLAACSATYERKDRAGERVVIANQITSTTPPCLLSVANGTLRAFPCEFLGLGTHLCHEI